MLVGSESSLRQDFLPELKKRSHYHVTYTNIQRKEVDPSRKWVIIVHIIRIITYSQKIKLKNHQKSDQD